MLGFLNIGPGEVVVILVIALVVLGPSRLPATARTLGRFMARTRDVVARFQQEMQAAADLPLEVIARERGRLQEPIRTSDRTGTPQSDEPESGDGEPAVTATEPDEIDETVGGASEAPAASESDSEPEDHDAR
ncbi:MAG: twin-arginine translocase TatA/TatE family subunit [bacterium]|nr:twin-arginine translocase TatA/TatE family subunit [bacterium]